MTNLDVIFAIELAGFVLFGKMGPYNLVRELYFDWIAVPIDGRPALSSADFLPPSMQLRNERANRYRKILISLQAFLLVGALLYWAFPHLSVGWG